MMMRSNNSGPRSDAWSESKLTNQSGFDPQNEEIGRIIGRYYEEYSNSSDIVFRALPLNDAFVMPVTLAEVQEHVLNVPEEFRSGLKAVFLCGGSNKQERAASTFAYGRYRTDKIILHPYPKSWLRRRYKNPPKPHILHDYEWVGARFHDRKNEFIIEFTPDALREFYLHDVLMHEIGHHVDKGNFDIKRQCRTEPFAEWFATEHGFRLRGRP